MKTSKISGGDVETKRNCVGSFSGPSQFQPVQCAIKLVSERFFSFLPFWISKQKPQQQPGSSWYSSMMLNIYWGFQQCLFERFEQWKDFLLLWNWLSPWKSLWFVWTYKSTVQEYTLCCAFKCLQHKFKFYQIARSKKANQTQTCNLQQLCPVFPKKDHNSP